MGELSAESLIKYNKLCDLISEVNETMGIKMPVLSIGDWVYLNEQVEVLRTEEESIVKKHVNLEEEMACDKAQEIHIEYTSDDLRDALGSKFEDTVTGFTGKCTGVCVYIGGDTSLQIENKEATRWVDLNRLKEVK